MRKIDFFRRSRSAFRSFGFSERGVAAVEFALIAPVLVLLFIGTIETSRYLGVMRRVQNASADIGLALSASDEIISGSNLWHLYNMMPILIPDVISDMRLSGEKVWWHVAGLNMSFITLENADISCKKGQCNYVAKVNWVYGQNPRPCGLAAFGDRPTEIPPQFWKQPANIFSVEIKYKFVPLFMTFLKDKITVERTFFAPSRKAFVTVTKLGDGGGLGRIC